MTFERDRTVDKNRRNAMIWLLYGAGSTYQSIGAALGVTRSRAAEFGGNYERVIRRRAAGASSWPDAFAARLRAAGAI